jgi:hypothetical protein
MTKINIDEHRKEGKIDWKAYEDAEIAAGQLCLRCKERIIYPLLSEWTGGRRLCNSCKNMDTDKGEVSHHIDLRCPKCGFLMNVNDYDLWECGLWEEGEHEIYCVKCDHKFTVTTNTSHSFDSPAREVEEIE